MNFDLLWKNYGTLEKQLCYYGENHATMNKTMILLLKTIKF